MSTRDSKTSQERFDHIAVEGRRTGCVRQHGCRRTLRPGRASGGRAGSGRDAHPAWWLRLWGTSVDSATERCPWQRPMRCTWEAAGTVGRNYDSPNAAVLGFAERAESILTGERVGPVAVQ